jgi:hypothetical protein
MSIKLVIISLGYAESSTTAHLVFCSGAKKKPKNSLEAVHSLAEFLYQKYLIDTNFERDVVDTNRCCKKYIGSEPFCPKCGTSLEKKNKPFDWEHWKEYLFALFHSDCDSYGAEDEVPNPHQWSTMYVDFAVNKNQFVHLTTYGDEMISIALSEIHPEFITDKDEIARDWIFVEYNQEITGDS